MNYRRFFEGKKITIMGLGLLGRGVGVSKFLAECGAELIITDLKKEEDLKSSLKKLEKFSNIKFVLGEHRLEDFRDRDMIIKAAGVPLDSPFIEEARKNGIPVEMDASLFARLAEGVKIIGVTGTRGKSTVTHLLYEILESSRQRVFLGGNVRGLSTLPLLKKVKEGDIVLMELDSWQLQGFGDSKISPNIAVFTTFLRDHQNYYKGDMEKYFSDKANIYRYQKKEDVLFMRPEVAKFIKNKDKENLKEKTVVVNKKSIPNNWKVKLLGDHNLENVALAISTAKYLGIKENIIKKTVEKFTGVPGRLEFIREIKGVKFYNDTTATTPDGVIAGMDSLKKYKGKIILIGGGADKALEYPEYAKVIKKNIISLFLFKGVASDKIVKELGKTKFPVYFADSMKVAVKSAFTYAEKGDVILLSPGAASFGVFKNEFDRGDQFVNAVKKL
ncbi:MAG: UDP-N-acetylmuramoylalanine-D-glutamate ligase [Parcubacteria group bacterium GW2011_GWF2_38_76]|nr:MAG: UDP-N-acetylmuramoylalanine-D-glutamate ligase [Parcubacteria group bacterium GW2011_GWF2_38_76]HBM45837.1 UDP-N-acetylmuramoyl-L-alanine--D-glutamate ligase [Patescibacteria group bacterium]